MKRTIILLLQAIAIVTVSTAQELSVNIIPKPAAMQVLDGHYDLPRQMVISMPSNKELDAAIGLLKERIVTATGHTIRFINDPKATADIIITLNEQQWKEQMGEEGYRLNVTEKHIWLEAAKPSGIFHAVQSLLQLFPAEIMSRSLAKGVQWQLPCVNINDRPRFAWRGLMLDVVRHWFTKQQVKDFIDEMAIYKYNLLHLHLTDDEGWRIQIKALPKLTEVGAWRVNKVGTFGNMSKPTADEPRDYGGFYTQDDIRELVQYAKARYIEILPEVDVPGHSLAAVASYPELSCTPDAVNYKVRSGERIMDWLGDGKFSAQIDNTLCPANEKVYDFLDKVFTEVADLFPFGYIHMGGDECAKNFWRQNPQILALMQRERLKDSNEVQSYFVKRVGKIIESKGKRMIGWDEIMEGGLAPNAVVMSWRGMKGGIEAAHMGHEAVMSPTTFAYFDYMQSDKIIEPPVYASLRSKTVYGFDPVPEGVDPKFIKGGQANLWSEQLYNTRHLQYMLWPRGMAMSECLWSPKEAKDWNKFVQRVEHHFDRMDLQQVKYAKAIYDPIFTPRKDSVTGQLKVELSTEVEGLDLYYSFDNSHPDAFYPRYTGALSVPKDASMLKVVSYRNGKPIGRQLDMPIKELKTRAGIKD